jgi:hypothetical protein
MALARIASIEQLRYAAAGEWGNLLGLDRVPEVRTLREKLKLLCAEQGRAARWNAALAKEWIGQREIERSSGLAFYIDGHVRVYHGELTKLPRHYVPRERFYLRATVDYWVNALDGEPFCYFNQAVDHGLVQALRGDVLPWLEANVTVSAEHQRRMAEDPRAPRFTVIVDREGYSPDLFLDWQKERIAALTYHRYPDGEDWRAEEFQEQTVKLVNGETVRMKLAERGTHVGKRKVSRSYSGMWASRNLCRKRRSAATSSIKAKCKNVSSNSSRSWNNSKSGAGRRPARSPFRTSRNRTASRDCARRGNTSWTPSR